MRRLFSTIQILLVILGLFANVGTSTVSAIFDPSGCNGITIQANGFPDNYTPDNSSKTVTFNFSKLTPDDFYNITIDGNFSATEKSRLYRFKADSSGKATVATELRTSPLTIDTQAIFRFKLQRGVTVNGDKICDLGESIAQKGTTGPTNISCSLRIWQTYIDSATSKEVQCFANNDQDSCMQRNSKLFVEATITDENGIAVPNQPIDIQLSDRFWGWQGGDTNFEGKITESFDGIKTGNYQVEVSVDRTGSNNISCNNIAFTVNETCVDETGKRSCSINNTPIVTPDFSQVDAYQLCAQIPSESLKKKCHDCAIKGSTDGSERGSIWTAVGCIQRDPKSIIQSLMQIGLGMGGGVALISVLAGGFILSTSQGDPQKVNQAKEIITNSIIGLLFIIFSVVLLQFIGVTIFNIPGFGSVK